MQLMFFRNFVSIIRMEPPGETTRLFMSIEGWLDLGNLEEAASELHALPPELKATSSFAKAWIRIYELQKDWANVEILAASLRSQKPDDLFSISKLAESYFQQHRPVDAICALGEALANEEWRENPKVRYNLARYFCGAGQMKKARECLRKAIEADKTLRGKTNDDPDFENLWKEK